MQQKRQAEHLAFCKALSLSDRLLLAFHRHVRGCYSENTEHHLMHWYTLGRDVSVTEINGKSFNVWRLSGWDRAEEEARMTQGKMEKMWRGEERVRAGKLRSERWWRARRNRERCQLQVECQSGSWLTRECGMGFWTDVENEKARDGIASIRPALSPVQNVNTDLAKTTSSHRAEFQCVSQLE